MYTQTRAKIRGDRKTYYTCTRTRGKIEKETREQLKFLLPMQIKKEKQI
jgi:hypothetical protein